MREQKKRAEKLSHAERHRRFVETAKKVGASEKIDALDLAFDKLVIRTKTEKNHTNN